MRVQLTNSETNSRWKALKGKANEGQTLASICTVWPMNKVHQPNSCSIAMYKSLNMLGPDDWSKWINHAKAWAEYQESERKLQCEVHSAFKSIDCADTVERDVGKGEKTDQPTQRETVEDWPKFRMGSFRWTNVEIRAKLLQSSSANAALGDGVRDERMGRWTVTMYNAQLRCTSRRRERGKRHWHLLPTPVRCFFTSHKRGDSRWKSRLIKVHHGRITHRSRDLKAEVKFKLRLRPGPALVYTPSGPDTNYRMAITKHLYSDCETRTYFVSTDVSWSRDAFTLCLLSFPLRRFTRSSRLPPSPDDEKVKRKWGQTQTNFLSKSLYASSKCSPFRSFRAKKRQITR